MDEHDRRTGPAFPRIALSHNREGHGIVVRCARRTPDAHQDELLDEGPALVSVNRLFDPARVEDHLFPLRTETHARATPPFQSRFRASVSLPRCSRFRTLGAGPQPRAGLDRISG